MTWCRWHKRAPARGVEPARSHSLLGAALVLAGALALAKSALLVHALGFENAPRPAAQAAGADLASASLPEPEAGPDRDGTGDHAHASRSVAKGPGADVSAHTDLDPALLDASEREILDVIAARRAHFDERARELEIRAAVLETAEARLAMQLEQLAQLHAAITALVETHEEEEAAKLAQLVKIYEMMKPKAAAEIFERLEMGVLLRVVSQMNAAKSSAVIARMSAKRAEQLTAELARRTDLQHLAP